MSATIDFGIDLGTTNSAIAWQDGAQTKLLTDPSGGDLLPSAVHASASGALTVGKPARELRHTPGEHVAIEFKRQMGTSNKIELGGKSYLPEELSSEVLKELLKWAKSHGHDVESSVITIPAMFELPQCDATRRAAELAGLKHVVLLQEPIAAAIAHSGETGKREGYWMVYDLGGGTFDVSLVRARKGRLQVLDHDGDNHLGGRDLDRAVARWAIEQVREEKRFGALPRSDPRYEEAFERLRAEAERTRIALSTTREAPFRVENLVRSGHGAGETFERQLTREALEALISPIIDRTTRLCRELLERNKVASKELEAIVMVGGPTQTPCIPGLLEKGVEIKAEHRVDPMSIVARGAALFASTQKRPRGAAKAGVVEVHLEHETMTTNPEPLVVGRNPGKELAGGKVRAQRRDGGWGSGEVPVDAEGKFAIELELVRSQLNAFKLEAKDASGKPRPIDPAELRILHGFSVANPPLSQSVGVMLADNTVAWYLRKGAVLPARGSATHVTTLSLRRGQSGEAVHVPLVQGESGRADRNRVIGVLHIHADKLPRDLPAGSEVRVEIVVDESSQTSGRAYVPLLDMWFSDVVRFNIEARSANEVSRSLAAQKDRLAQLSAMADELDEEVGAVDDRIKEVEELLEEGDRDSVDVADSLVRMMASKIDAAESRSRLDDLKADFEAWWATTQKLLSTEGTDGERRQLEAIGHEFDDALVKGDLDLAAARLEDMRKLYDRVVVRAPGFWVGMFQFFKQKIAQQPSMRAAAQMALMAGEDAIRAQNWNALVKACLELNQLLPPEERKAIDGGGVVSHIK